MKKKKKQLILLTIILLILDILSKSLVVRYLKDELIIIKDFLSFIFLKNTGTLWGLFKNMNLFFIILSFLALGFLIYYLNKLDDLNKSKTIAFSLVFAGIIGNLIDRIIRKYVVDFISFKFFNYYFPVFNFADSYIVIAIIILTITILKEEKNEIR